MVDRLQLPAVYVYLRLSICIYMRLSASVYLRLSIGLRLSICCLICVCPGHLFASIYLSARVYRFIYLFSCTYLRLSAIASVAIWPGLSIGRSRSAYRSVGNHSGHGIVSVCNCGMSV